MHTRLERVVLGLVRELALDAEVAAAHDELPPPRVVRIRDHHLTFGVGGVVAAGIADRRIGDQCARMIEHLEYVPGSAETLDRAECALADHRAAGHAVADELDDVHARLREAREFERTSNAPQRRFVVLEGPLLVRDEAVEVDRRVDLAHAAR